MWTFQLPFIRDLIFRIYLKLIKIKRKFRSEKVIPQEINKFMNS
jgi:hypothetical protein